MPDKPEERDLGSLNGSQIFALGCFVGGTRLLKEDGLVILAGKLGVVIANHGQVLETLEKRGYLKLLGNGYFQLIPLQSQPSGGK